MTIIYIDVIISHKVKQRKRVILMKITNELKAKIEREMQKKLNDKIVPIRVLRDEALTKANNEVFKKVLAVVEKDEHLSYFFTHYRISKKEDFISNSLGYFYDTKEITKDFDEKIKTLEANHKLALESLMISLSYEKNLEGIKKIFTENGLTF